MWPAMLSLTGDGSVFFEAIGQLWAKCKAVFQSSQVLKMDSTPVPHQAPARMGMAGAGLMGRLEARQAEC